MTDKIFKVLISTIVTTKESVALSSKQQSLPQLVFQRLEQNEKNSLSHHCKPKFNGEYFKDSNF